MDANDVAVDEKIDDGLLFIEVGDGGRDGFGTTVIISVAG